MTHVSVIGTRVTRTVSCDVLSGPCVGCKPLVFTFASRIGFGICFVRVGFSLAPRAHAMYVRYQARGLCVDRYQWELYCVDVRMSRRPSVD